MNASISEDGSTPEDASESPEQALAQAERHFHQAISLFQQMTQRVESGETVPQIEAQRASRALHAAAQTLFTLRQRMENERKKQTGIVNSYALDLDAARRDVERRLARLRDARDAGEVS